MKLSACLIVKNEEKHLTKCIRSFKQYVDEIIVVDTGSTDRSKELARELGARVYDFKWRNDFSAAKNFAKQKAKGDWILFLDADEYFIQETAKNLKNTILQFQAECDAFLIKLIDIDADNHDEYIDEFYAMRMFKNSSALCYRNEVHEELYNKTGRKNRLMKIDASLLCLYHTGYSSKRVEAKCRRNLKILLSKLTGNQEKDKFLYRYLADSYHGLEDYENAIKYAKLDIQTGKKEIAYASRSYRVLHSTLARIKADEQQRRHWYQKAIEAFPQLPDFFAMYAYFLYTIGEYDAAINYLETAFQKAADYEEIESSSFANDENAYHVLSGILYAMRNDYENAEREYKRSLEMNPYFLPAFYEWLKLLKICYSDEEAEVKIKQLYPNETNQTFLKQHIGTVSKSLIDKLQGKEKNKMKDHEPALQQSERESKIFYDYLLLADLLAEGTEHVDLPETQNRIWLAYQQEIVLDDRDFEKYMGILNALLIVKDNDKILERYITVAQKFSLPNMKKIADILFENQVYKLSAVLYHLLLEKIGEQEGFLEVLEKTAEAFYYARQDEIAKQYFSFLISEYGESNKYRFYLDILEGGAVS